jgi:hypothetical protein
LFKQGFEFDVYGQKRNFKGTITIILADNPASQAVGGFKESSAAFQNCRFCFDTNEDIRTNVNIIFYVAIVTFSLV